MYIFKFTRTLLSSLGRACIVLTKTFFQRISIHHQYTTNHNSHLKRGVFRVLKTFSRDIMGKKKAPSSRRKKKKNETESTAMMMSGTMISSWIKGLASSFFLGNKKKEVVEIPQPMIIGEAAAASAPEVQTKKKRRKKTVISTRKKKSKYPPIPKPKRRGRPKMLVRKSYGGRAPRKIYAGLGRREILYGDERYCIRCCERLKEDNLWGSSESECEGEDFITDKVIPWLDPHVCLVCREKGGDTDEEDWR